MNERLDKQYFKWLYKNVCSLRDRDPSRSYWTLLDQLLRKEFVWLVPNDDNRAEDGRNLRLEFLDSQRSSYVDSDWMRLGCSMLELLIGISRRLSFETERNSREWFWELIENLELDEYNDNSPIPSEDIDEVLDRVIWRIYKPDGFGGLFPLKRTGADQRRIELWYQMSEYVLEKDSLFERRPA